ncbi:MAG: hypothetical protein COV76_04305 [Candidatus Omnitrophica bacterium CG11_big_fil_rev_8_21_14_0_20_64_10]|nr:MAG: hypothetical protein COV76_04305 [Candidatus Omnitrophica bacterium CG11_big_fil_rev_8_21_14_0_20_64_10]
MPSKGKSSGSFAEIVGLESAVRLFEGQLASGEVPHTLLLQGPAGVGKRKLALELAGILSEGQVADLTVVEPESPTGQLKIDQLRELVRWLTLTPRDAARKVGVIMEADRMGVDAANACLKFLEEPPDRSVLILVTAAPHRMLPTILSRCHVVRCFPQGAARVEQFLRETEKLPAGAAKMLAALSGGRLGEALRLHREGLAQRKNAVLDELLSTFRSGGVEPSLASASRLEIEEGLGWLAGWWRDLLVLALGGDPAWVIHQDRLKELQAGPTPDPLLLMKRVEQTCQLQEAVRRNANAKIALAALMTGAIDG